MSDNNETPSFVYNGKILRVLYISMELQYVSIKDIAEVSEILPFITRCVDKRYVLESNGEKWIENNVFAEVMHAFHPDIQKDIIKQTLESVLKDVAEAGRQATGGIEDGIQELKRGLLDLFNMIEDTNDGK